jgi:hypothetical protein
MRTAAATVKFNDARDIACCRVHADTDRCDAKGETSNARHKPRLELLHSARHLSEDARRLLRARLYSDGIVTYRKLSGGSNLAIAAARRTVDNAVGMSDVDVTFVLALGALVGSRPWIRLGHHPQRSKLN